MVLEKNIKVIVMLCRVRELGRNGEMKEKCFHYWPENEKSPKIIGNFFSIFTSLELLFRSGWQSRSDKVDANEGRRSSLVDLEEGDSS